MIIIRIRIMMIIIRIIIIIIRIMVIIIIIRIIQCNKINNTYNRNRNDAKEEKWKMQIQNNRDFNIQMQNLKNIINYYYTWSTTNGNIKEGSRASHCCGCWEREREKREERESDRDALLRTQQHNNNLFIINEIKLNSKK